MKTQRGITLISLVITIIVMLILAAVSLSTVVGEGGILNRAISAKDETEEAAELEKENLDKLDKYVEDYFSFTFTIDGTKQELEVKNYMMEEGMTWAEWVDSEYNTDGYIIYKDKLSKIISATSNSTQYAEFETEGMEKDDVILNKKSYIISETINLDFKFN